MPTDRIDTAITKAEPVLSAEEREWFARELCDRMYQCIARLVAETFGTIEDLGFRLAETADAGTD